MELTPLEKLVSIPANHVSRFKDIPIEEFIKSKIYGKPKEFTNNELYQAGLQTYPNLIYESTHNTTTTLPLPVHSDHHPSNHQSTHI